MSRVETEQVDPDRNRKWILPAVLVVLILAILIGAFFATHPNVFGGGSTDTPTATPTVQVTATPLAGPTGTPKTGPTGTPGTAPTGTPRPGPTGTPKPTATSTPMPTPTPTV
jgi:hypothetical protein